MEGSVDTSPTASAATNGRVEPAESGRAIRIVRWIERHPLVVVAIVASAVAVAHAVWIWRVRTLGAFDPDESSYLSSALRMQRSIDLRNPLELPSTILATGHGVTVPMLSVPLLIAGPRDPRTAMLIQPILLVFIAVATAGITLRTTQRRPIAAIVAGTWVVLLPTITTAVQSYWYGLGAAAALAGATWALVASEGGTNRTIWWYGVGIGLMCMTRTMTIGFLPGCAVAGLVVAWPDRRAIRRVVGAFALGLAIAAPWYLANVRTIFGYLLEFGYGSGATEFGENAVSDRLDLRYDRMVDGLGLQGFVPWLLLLLVFVVVQFGRRRPASTPGRPLLAVATVAALGSASLVSTANNGVWFELPLVVLMVALIVSVAAKAPVPGGILLAIVMINTAVLLPSALWLREWSPSRPVSHYEWGFSEYDERFRPDRRDEHEAAAADWWRLAVDLEQELRRISPDGRGKVFVTTGNTHLYNANVVRMAAELDGWDFDLVIPNTKLDPEERADYLRAPSDASGFDERVLVVGVHDQILWQLDVEVRSFLAQARAAGFEETARFVMPRGGHVAVLRRPSTD